MIGQSAGRERQQATYRAEETLSGTGRRFANVAEVQRYVDELTEEPWFQDAWNWVTGVEIQRLRVNRAICAGASYAEDLLIGLVVLEEPIVLHELAHLCAGRGQGHGERFTVAFLALVRARMGFHAYGALRAALEAEGVLDKNEQV